MKLELWEVNKIRNDPLLHDKFISDFYIKTEILIEKEYLIDFFNSIFRFATFFTGDMKYHYLNYVYHTVIVKEMFKFKSRKGTVEDFENIISMSEKLIKISEKILKMK